MGGIELLLEGGMFQRIGGRRVATRVITTAIAVTVKILSLQCERLGLFFLILAPPVIIFVAIIFVIRGNCLHSLLAQQAVSNSTGQRRVTEDSRDEGEVSHEL
jgi:hypothetical protein